MEEDAIQYNAVTVNNPLEITFELIDDPDVAGTDNSAADVEGNSIGDRVTIL